MNEAEIDRLGELANIGAGHAADAFAQLAGRTMWMRVPQVRAGDEPVAWSANPEDEFRTGVFFEFDGFLDAVVGILFRRGPSEEVVRRLVGNPEGEPPLEAVESALTEVGNILASHVASAIADTVGERVLPSIPVFAMDSAEATLSGMLAEREGRHPIRFECELFDSEGRVGGLLVLIPSEPAAD